jgi:hypothetical protein
MLPALPGRLHLGLERQGHPAPPPSGQQYYAYGGDFGPDFDYAALFQQNEDPQMCCNGIVGPDLTPHPGAFEVKKVQAPVGGAALAVRPTRTGYPAGEVTCGTSTSSSAWPPGHPLGAG